MTDVLLVSLGTTHGLRVADSMLIEMLREAGASTDGIRVRIGATDVLRRGYPVNDVVEGVAAGRALAGALANREHPRAVVFSTTTAAMLARTNGIPYAVRLDSPAALNRRGVHNAAVRALERRSLARARLVLALGAGGAAALPAGSARAEIVPVPIDPSGDITGARDPNLAVAYVPDPKTKGLELLCRAWAQAGAGRRLEIFGLERDRALRFLARRRVAEPAGVTCRGYVAGETFRTALRSAHCFVSAASWEDYGQAPLEAMRDGALLVTSPAGGPYEALAIARELDPTLVAEDLRTASLADAITAAFARDDHAVASYQQRAAAKLDPYLRERAVDALRTLVLPVLLD